MTMFWRTLKALRQARNINLWRRDVCAGLRAVHMAPNDVRSGFVVNVRQYHVGESEVLFFSDGGQSQRWVPLSEIFPEDGKFALLAKQGQRT